MKHFNELTPAEAERLALLLEEMGEALQIVGKVLRHGMESCHPEDHMTTNRDLLTKELGDVRFSIELLCSAEDISRLQLAQAVLNKADKVAEYLHHQPRGLVESVQQAWRP